MDDDKERKERMASEELKRRMKGDMEKDMYEDDNLFRKFLIARDFNVDNSEAMLRQHLEWRKKNDVKNIFKWSPPQVVKNYFILTDLGTDKEGCILKYNHFGNTDFRGIFESCTLEEWLKSLIYIFEQDIILLKKHCERLGKLVDKTVYIENLENFSLAKATDKKVISYLIQSISLYLNNYPESLKEVYVINAPVYFNIFFAFIKVCLPNTVIRKIKIYSDDSWKRDLLEAVDAEVLPKFLGGKRTDPDGNPLCPVLAFVNNLKLNLKISSWLMKLLRRQCVHKNIALEHWVDHELTNTLPEPKPVPKSLYISRSKKSFPTIKDAEKITVSRASGHEIVIEVKEPCSHLEWEFEVKSGDIRFGILYKDQDGKKFEAVPPEKINTSEYSGSGLYKCENAGTYFDKTYKNIVIFDNSYSILKVKEIWYKIKVSNPQEEIPLE